MPESFEKKLYTPRDIEGKPNNEALEQLRDIEDYLRGKYFSGDKKLIGVASMGSIVSGYSA